MIIIVLETIYRPQYIQRDGSFKKKVFEIKVARNIHGNIAVIVSKCVCKINFK